MKIYKYTSQEHAIGLLRYGKFRVGTLYEYRNLEHVSGVADPNEGRKTISGKLNEQFLSGEEVPKTLTDLGILSVSPGPTNITFTNTTFKSSISSEDAYIWCGSKLKSFLVQQEFEGTDSCVEISNPEAFFALLSEFMALKYDAEFIGLFTIEYRERVEEWQRTHLGVHPATIKEPHFSEQKEVRAIWQPRQSGIISPIISRLPALSRYCKLVTVSKA